jgi:hypothetical protein
MAVLLVAIIGVPHRVAAAPSCFPPVEIPHAKIIRVERNGVLVLADGRAAKLEGILLPAGAADDAPEFYAGQAIAELGELATGHVASFAAQPPKEDRYGRLRAQVLLREAGAENPWLQVELLRRGLARVSLAPDRGECASELYAAEIRSRAAKAGIWSSAAYRLRTPEEAAAQTGSFQIVEGTVQSVSNGGGRIFLEFGPDRRTDFAVTISGDDLKTFRAIGVDPFSYANRTVRVRGWIARLRRPEMDIATPQDIEVLGTPDLRGWIDPGK